MFGSPLPLSYASPFASGARASRVRAAARRYGALTRIAELPRAPRFVAVPPAPGHVAVDYGEVFDVVTPAGVRLVQEAAKIPRDHVLVFPEGYVTDGVVTHLDPSLDEDGKVIFTTGAESSGRTWGARFDGTRWTSVVTVGPARGRPDPAVIVYAEARFAPPRTATKTVWSENLKGTGCGAVADGGQVVVVTEARELIVFSGQRAPGPPRGERQAATTLPFAAADVSLLEFGIALTSRQEDRHEVHLRDAGGAPLWSCASPVAPLQPVVDGGQGRAIVAGEGLASLSAGRVLWGARAPGVTRATAFADGVLAVTVGAELRVVGPDGTIAQALACGEGEQWTTAPAIAADGSIWAATQRALYVAT